MMSAVGAFFFPLFFQSADSQISNIPWFINYVTMLLILTSTRLGRFVRFDIYLSLLIPVVRTWKLVAPCRNTI